MDMFIERLFHLLAQSKRLLAVLILLLCTVATIFTPRSRVLLYF